MKAIKSLISQYRGLRQEIYILFFGRIVTNLGSMVWPMLTMILSQKLGMSAFAISVLTVASMCIMLPADLLGGRLADRRNKKHVIVVCDFISVACYVLCAAIPLSYVTVALMLAAGICQSMENPSYDALIADLSTTADRERAYSLQYLGGNLGLVLSPTIAGFLFKDYLWLAFLISGVAIACSTVLIALRVRDITPVRDESEAAAYQATQDDAKLGEILRNNRILILYLLAASLYWAAYSQYSYLMPLDMGKVHGDAGAVLYGTVSSLNCIVVVLFTPLITRLFRRMPETKKLLCGMLLAAAGYLAFLLLIGHIPIYYLAMLLFTWGEIFCTISDGPYLTSRVPSSHRGRINGFSAVLGTVIQSVCSLSVGQLYDRMGRTWAWTLVLAILAAAAILSFILIRRDRVKFPKLYEKTQNAD
jgi:MFS family permease